MLKWLSAVAALLMAVAAVACNDDDDDKGPEATKPAATEGPSTYNVQVDGTAHDYNSGFTAYFPNAVAVHAGDTVRFGLVDTLGEGPHTVTFGTYVDAVQKVVLDFCGPEGVSACPEDSPPPPEFDAANAKLPSLLPEGPGDANQAAANPCFLESGDAPAEGPCAKREQPAFSGTQTLYSSGWLSPNEDFTVKLADNIAPGSYTWICLLHNVEMTGTLTVGAKSAKADTPSEVEERGAQQLDDLAAKLKPAADELRAATVEKALAGNGAEDVPNGAVLEFGPKEASIPVGGSVTWTVIGAHTISFNAPEDTSKLRIEAPDGTVHINERAVTPAGGPGQPPPPEGAEEGPPPDPNAPPVVIDAGSYDGSSFLSSGLILSFPGEGVFAYKVTFTTAGTYTYKCLIHDKMEGTVKVGG